MSNNASSRDLHAVTKARYQKEMREELLSKGALSFLFHIKMGNLQIKSCFYLSNSQPFKPSDFTPSLKILATFVSDVAFLVCK